MSVVIETTIGDITVDLYLKERPNACLNFLKLCKIKYYNLCVFHKVERNFIAQTGDPTSTGRGGESVFASLYGDQAKYFEAELKPRLKHDKLGTLSMVNNGNNMNGSQFFITLAENLTYLDEVHTVFGEVAEGFEVLLKLNEVICDPNNRPFQDIRITHTVILHDPYDDPPGLEIPDASPIPTKEMLETDYIAADEEIDDSKGKNIQEIEEKIKDSEAKARATILEMVGDLPDADVKPPENVLFVCKLNPVTTSEDLELIFSRFGPIVSCEVIKDKKSGESLQYAFIEFEKEEDCENAYFKMDNVLIDDRRIHVDFSQSVSKLNWDMTNKSSKDESNQHQNFVIKDRNKKSDGYEMIFDTDADSKYSRKDHKDQYKIKTSSKERSYKSHDIRRSPDFSHRRSHSDNYQSHSSKLSSKSKVSGNYSKSRQKRSRSPSPSKLSPKNNSRYSKSPSRSRSLKTFSQQLNRKHSHPSNSASADEQEALSYKHKHHSSQHYPERTKSNCHSNDRKKDMNSSYYESSRSHSSVYSKDKHSSRKISRSPHKKRSKTPVSSPSHSISPKRYRSEETSNSKKSLGNRSKSSQHDKYQRKISSKYDNLKDSKVEKHKSKTYSDSSDYSNDSDSNNTHQKKVSSDSLKYSKEYKKHKKSKPSYDSSDSSDDSRTDVNCFKNKSKQSSSHKEYVKYGHSHKNKHRKHSSS